MISGGRRSRRRRGDRQIKFLVTLLSLLAGVIAAGLAAAADRKMPQGEWKVVDCPLPSAEAQLPITCGRLTVPENYDDPNSRKITVAAMIIHSRVVANRTEPVIFLNGGPGGTSLESYERFIRLPIAKEIIGNRDWVFFDQRGTGRSDPALLCTEEGGRLRIVKPCRDRFIKAGVDLSQYNSVRIADDVEALRKALGVRQWNVYGGSYGTRLAFTMARYYPASIHAIVHDAAYLPEDQETVDDGWGAEVAMERLFAKCEADAACAQRYPDLRNRFLAALDRLATTPMQVGTDRVGDRGVMHFARGLFFDHTAGLGFERRVQSTLAFMDAAARGDGAAMLKFYQMVDADENMQAKLPPFGRVHVGQSLSVDCNEEKPFESPEEFERARARSPMQRAFLKGLADQIFQSCALWPAGRADPIENTHVYFNGPQLVFTGEMDASLSLLAGYKIAMLYPNARNVVFRNGGHVQFRKDDSRPTSEDHAYRICAVRLARTFFDDPAAPLDTKCAETRRLRLVPDSASR